MAGLKGFGMTGNAPAAVSWLSDASLRLFEAQIVRAGTLPSSVHQELDHSDQPDDDDHRPQHRGR